MKINSFNQYPLHRRAGFIDSAYAQARNNKGDIQGAREALKKIESTQAHPRYDFNPHIQRLREQIGAAARIKSANAGLEVPKAIEDIQIDTNEAVHRILQGIL